MYARVVTFGFIFLYLACGAQAAVETLNYDIILFGDKVGEMTLTHESRTDGTDLYVLDTRSKAKILWINRDNVSHYELVYKNGKMLSCTVKEVENGQLKRWNNIKWDGKVCAVEGHQGKFNLSEQPTYSTITAYFQNVQNVNRFFYEPEGDFATVQHPDANTVEFTTSDGHRSVYHYVNGRIDNMEFHVSIATVKMVRRK